MANPVVTVLMNVRNGDRYLRDAIASVRAQTFQAWELLVVDNASTDKTQSIVTALMAQEPRIRYDWIPSPVTLGAARQRGLLQAHGECLAILDCDDLWQPAKLFWQVQQLCRDPLLGGVYSDAWVMDAEDQLRGLCFSRTPPPVGDAYAALVTGRNYMPGPTLLFDTKRLKMVGGFDPVLSYAETYDACVRMARQFRMVPLRKITASYRIHERQASGRGCPAMTREVLTVLGRQHRLGLRLYIGCWRRRIILRAKLWWQQVQEWYARTGLSQTSARRPPTAGAGRGLAASH